MLIHILSVDPATGKPGEQIYTKQVIFGDNSMIIDVDVNNDNWVMSADIFYVAIEWQKAPINERLMMGNDEIVYKTTSKGKQRTIDAPLYRMIYQPALITYVDTHKYTAYYMNQPGNWQRYDTKITLMVQGIPVPYDTHVALSATVTY